MLRLIALAILSTATLHARKEEKRTDALGREYWLYTPDKIDAGKTYRLAVGVHGHKGNGKGAGGLAGWVDKYDDVIVVGPTFPSTGPFYQLLEGNTEKQLIDLQKKLSSEFRLYPKMFLSGHSGGSQFVHRFAGYHPQLVCGAEASSGGTWSRIDDSCAGVLWTFSCGLRDTNVSEGSVLSRIDGFRAFYKSVDSRPFTAKPFVTPGKHEIDKAMRASAEECFRVSTTGLFDHQRGPTQGMSPAQRESWLEKDNARLSDREFNDGKSVYKLRVNEAGWTLAAPALRELKKTRLLIDRVQGGEKAPLPAPGFPASPRGMPIIK